MRGRTFRVRLTFSSLSVLAVTALAGWWVTRTIVRTQAELVRGRVELERRNRELDAFAGRVAHELRGPLATLGLEATMIDEGTRKTDVPFQHAIDQMENLLDALLQLSRVGAMPSAPVPIESIAPSLTTDLDRLVTGVGGTLAVDLQRATVSCNEALLRRLLWNLAENAVKYRRRDAPLALTIDGRVVHGRYEIRVADNGIGMSGDEAQRAFEPFFRSKHARALPGAGLGLAIVRRIVDASDGTVAVSSVLGHGSTFTVTLPLAA